MWVAGAKMAGFVLIWEGYFEGLNRRSSRNMVCGRCRVVASAGGRPIPINKENEDYSLEKLGFIEVGLVLGPHGVQGAAKVRKRR